MRSVSFFHRGAFFRGAGRNEKEKRESVAGAEQSSVVQGLQEKFQLALIEGGIKARDVRDVDQRKIFPVFAQLQPVRARSVVFGIPARHVDKKKSLGLCVVLIEAVAFGQGQSRLGDGKAQAHFPRVFVGNILSFGKGRQFPQYLRRLRIPGPAHKLEGGRFAVGNFQRQARLLFLRADGQQGRGREVPDKLPDQTGLAGGVFPDDADGHAGVAQFGSAGKFLSQIFDSFADSFKKVFMACSVEVRVGAAYPGRRRRDARRGFSSPVPRGGGLRPCAVSPA